MKKKFINLLGLGIISISLMGNTIPVFATEASLQISENSSSEVSESSESSSLSSISESSQTSESSESSESSEKQKEPSTLKISAYNQTNGKYESSVSFKVLNRATGNLVTFSKDGAGKYTVDSNGYYKYLEPSEGFVEIKGLNGSYTIQDTGNNSNLYCKDNENNFSIAEEETKSVSFNYVQNYGSLNITLLSEDESAIADAKFVLKNSNGSLVYFSLENGVYVYSTNTSMSELSTNAAGKIMLDKIPAGTYTLEQTSAPVVYNGALVSKSVTVENQKSVSLSVTNVKEYGDLVISVVDDNDNSKYLNGSEYVIKDSSGNFIYVSKNTDGSYSFSRTSTDTSISPSNGNLSVSGLPKGSYTLVEKTAPSNYNPCENKDFDIQKNNTTNIQMKNQRALGSISITITDEETGTPVEGFVYQLIDKTTEEPINFKESTTGFTYSLSGEAELVTDANGKLYLANIPTGDYYLKQVKAASGYLLNLDSIEQTISSNNETTYETLASKSNSAVVVVDKDENPVQNVSFDILDKDGNVVLSDVTNENGKFLISGIPAGDYTLTLKSVPETYNKEHDDIEFSIDETGLSEGLGKIVISYNEVSLNIGKKDISVVLTNKEDNSTITLKTDDKGIVVFSKLTNGEYSISLEDDSIAFETIEFTVDENFKNLSYDIDLVGNEELSSENNDAETPTTKKVNSGIIMIIIAIIVGASFGVYLYFAKKKQKNKNNIHVAYDEDGNAVIYEEGEEDINSDEETESSLENDNSLDDTYDEDEESEEDTLYESEDYDSEQKDDTSSEE